MPLRKTRKHVVSSLNCGSLSTKPLVMFLFLISMFHISTSFKQQNPNTMRVNWAIGAVTPSTNIHLLRTICQVHVATEPHVMELEGKQINKRLSFSKSIIFVSKLNLNTPTVCYEQDREQKHSLNQRFQKIHGQFSPSSEVYYGWETAQLLDPCRNITKYGVVKSYKEKPNPWENNWRTMTHWISKKHFYWVYATNTST